MTSFRQSLERETGSDYVRTRAPILLGNRETEEAEVTQRVPHSAIKATLDIALVSARFYDPSSEILDRLVEGELLLGEPEVH